VALKSNDVKALEAIFGPGSKDLLWSGDPVADQSGRERLLKLYEQKYRLEVTEAKAVLNLGTEDWPFAVPIVKKGGLWYFDTKQGKEEILARRIGQNELSAIKACLAYVDAQREYALRDRDADGLLEYAQNSGVTRGRRMVVLGGESGRGAESLGPLLCRSQEKGYSGKAGGKPIPYHGYYYRILKGQGKSAPGGAYDYMVKGNMLGGFALVAYRPSMRHRRHDLHRESRRSGLPKRPWPEHRESGSGDEALQSGQHVEESGIDLIGLKSIRI